MSQLEYCGSDLTICPNFDRIHPNSPWTSSKTPNLIVVQALGLYPAPSWAFGWRTQVQVQVDNCPFWEHPPTDVCWHRCLWQLCWDPISDKNFMIYWKGSLCWASQCQAKKQAYVSSWADCYCDNILSTSQKKIHLLISHKVTRLDHSKNALKFLGTCVRCVVWGKGWRHFHQWRNDPLERKSVFQLVHFQGKETRLAAYTWNLVAPPQENCLQLLQEYIIKFTCWHCNRSRASIQYWAISKSRKRLLIRAWKMSIAQVARSTALR